MTELLKTHSAPGVPHQAQSAPDQAAVAAMMAADPQWIDLVPARDAFGLADKTVLHAGPPIGDGELCAAIENSAVMAAVYENWAADETEARKLIRNGGVKLEPAQDFNAAVPLASVLTRRMMVHVVADGKAPEARAFSPINGGSGPALRLGLAHTDVIDHLRWLNGEFAEILRARSQREVPLIPIADQALAKGDDCHGRTPAASAMVADIILAGQPGGEKLDRARKFLSEGPSFFLNIWMAAAKCMLSAGDNHEGSSFVTAIGGNGVKTGIKLSGLPDRWFTADAVPPEGALEAGIDDADRLGAIGDSAIVDALGFGAMAMASAPAQLAALGAFMPGDWRALGNKIMAQTHNVFSHARIHTGFCAKSAVASRRVPAISLGIIDRLGERGRIGGGIYSPPISLFEAAWQTLRDSGFKANK
jgi:hypothetical protein